MWVWGVGGFDLDGLDLDEGFFRVLLSWDKMESVRDGDLLIIR